MLSSISAKPVRPTRVGVTVKHPNSGVAHRLVYVMLSVAAFTAPVVAQGANRLEDIRADVLPGNKVELTLRLSDTAPQPLTFTVDNPARIALDLADTEVAMSSRRIDVKQGVLDTVNVAEANGRTRVVLNVDSLVPYETRLDGNSGQRVPKQQRYRLNAASAKTECGCPDKGVL